MLRSCPTLWLVGPFLRGPCLAKHVQIRRWPLTFWANNIAVKKRLTDFDTLFHCRVRSQHGTVGQTDRQDVQAKLVGLVRLMTYCYTSTQNACTRLVKIRSRDVHKYTIVSSSATTQWNSALYGGTIDNEIMFIYEHGVCRMHFDSLQYNPYKYNRWAV